MVRKALEVQIGLAEQALHELQESGRKAMARFSVLERQGEKLSTEKNEIVKQRIYNCRITFTSILLGSKRNWRFGMWHDITSLHQLLQWQLKKIV